MYASNWRPFEPNGRLADWGGLTSTGVAWTFAEPGEMCAQAGHCWGDGWGWWREVYVERCLRDCDERRERPVYSANSLPTINCWRCGEPADVDWIDVRELSWPSPRLVQGTTLCMTPGCVDEDGSNATSAEPPTPEQIQARAERALARLREVWP